jgi:hypothetical protein
MKRLLFVVACVASTCAAVGPAQAQSAPRLSAGVTVGNSRTTADQVDGSQPTVGVAVAFRATPILSIEGEVARPTGVVSRQYSGQSISFATDPTLSREELERTFVVTQFTNERRTAALVSAGVVFHPRDAIGRVTPRLFLGVANHSVTERRTLVHLSLPPGVTMEQVNRAMAPETTWRRQLGGPTVGGSVAVRVTDQLSVVPDIRYTYGSIGDEINNWLRSSVRVMWRF